MSRVHLATGLEEILYFLYTSLINYAILGRTDLEIICRFIEYISICPLFNYIRSAAYKIIQENKNIQDIKPELNCLH